MGDIKMLTLVVELVSKCLNSRRELLDREYNSVLGTMVRTVARGFEMAHLTFMATSR